MVDFIRRGSLGAARGWQTPREHRSHLSGEVRHEMRAGISAMSVVIAPGNWTVRVSLRELVEDGHRETAELDADFALVVTTLAAGP